MLNWCRYDGTHTARESAMVQAQLTGVVWFGHLDPCSYVSLFDVAAPEPVLLQKVSTMSRTAHSALCVCVGCQSVCLSQLCIRLCGKALMRPMCCCSGLLMSTRVDQELRCGSQHSINGTPTQCTQAVTTTRCVCGTRGGSRQQYRCLPTCLLVWFVLFWSMDMS